MKKVKINYNIVIPIIILFFISILSIYSASIYTSKNLGNLVVKQVLWYFIGIITVILIMKTGNNKIYKYSYFLYIIGILLLGGLLVFAPSINGSKCWYILPGIGSIQVSEFMKIFIMLVLAIEINKFNTRYESPSIKNELLFLIKSFLIVLIPAILTFLQPDTGAVIIYLVIYIFMIFTSKIRFRWFIILSLIFLLSIGLFLYLYYFKENIFINIFGNSIYYRLDRILAWKSGSSLQLENAISSIGSASLLGHGFNNTPIYFPEASTDFIFAVYSSNFGLIGSLVLIVTIGYLDLIIINMSKRNINDKDKYILIGIAGMLIFQQIQNIGMTIGILPITGITLPFVSYGGSSLLSYMLLIGVILNISNTKKKKYVY